MDNEMQDLNDQRKMEIAQEGDRLEKKLKYLRSELEKLTLLLVELEKAKASLTAVKKDKESLLSIGGDVLISAKIQEDQILFPIGAGYYVKLEPIQATEKIDFGLSKIKETYKKINEEVKISETHLIELLRKVQEFGF